MAASTLIAALVLCAAQTARSCVYLMGESKDSVASHPAGTHWSYGFRGEDWEGVDGTNASWTCMTGDRQSPINLSGYEKRSKSQDDMKTTWSYKPLKSNGSNIKVFNNGHTIQVQWEGELPSDVECKSAGDKVTDVLNTKNRKNLKPYKLTPLQFHFHTTSEHSWNGQYFPLEMHIVHNIPQSVLPGCPKGGCLSVTGVLFHLSDDPSVGNPFLDSIWEVMPEQEGLVQYMKKGQVLDLESLLPKPGQRGYMQYEGSLTTPPCTQGLLWHVLKTPMPISLAQYDQYARAVGLKDCESLNSTDSTHHDESHGRRKAQEGSYSHHAKHSGHKHAHDHGHEEAHSRLASFQRGSYSGFVRAESEVDPVTHVTSRKLLVGPPQDEQTLVEKWKCHLVSYGFTNRNVQTTKNRTLLAFKN